MHHNTETVSVWNKTTNVYDHYTREQWSAMLAAHVPTTTREKQNAAVLVELAKALGL